MNIFHINKILKIILFSINCLYYDINLFSKFSHYISYLSFYNEMIEIENYLGKCEMHNLLKHIKKFEKKKISIVSSIFNRENFIKRFLNSIQNQNFQELEIILVDDCSKDNSIKIIENYAKKDKRIILIKNKRNKGTFAARNIGILYARGKYIILPDPDDIISKNILKYCYNMAEKNKYEIIRFTTYFGHFKLKFQKYDYKLGNNYKNQPELSTYIFYGYGELQIIDYNINNKFIKTSVFIKALNSLHYLFFNIHLTLYMTIHEDNIMNYILFTIANSFYFTKKIGYYHLKNYSSITKNKFLLLKFTLKCFLIYLKLFFEYTKTNKYEMDMFNFILNNSYNKIALSSFSMLTSRDVIDFCNKMINKYLNCKFMEKENKVYLQNLKKRIEKKFKLHL